MPQNPRLHILLSLLLVTALAGCSLLPHNPDWVEDAAALSRQLPDWDKLNASEGVLTLNQMIRSPRLDALLKEAFAYNASLQITLLTLQIQQQTLQQVSGQRLPQASASFSGGREQGSDTVYTGALGISWEVDLWNRLGNEVAAAELDVTQQQALYQSAQDTLAAEVMKAWLDLIRAKHAIDIQKRRLHTLQQNEQFVLLRYRNGLGSSEDLNSARTTIASARASLAAYEEQRQQAQRSLRILLGRTESVAIEFPHAYPDTEMPWVGAPEQTLQRRPDLKAAYLAVAAADRRADAAYQDLLPSINLQAALTDLASLPRAALLTDPLWSLLGQLTQPLYQGGQLVAAANMAELNTAQAYQRYRETLLTAVTEVEQALGQERSLARQQQHLEDALGSARINLEQYRNSYRRVTMLDLLLVQQNTYDLESQLDSIIAQRLGNRIDLGLALGLGLDQSWYAVAEQERR